MDHAGDERVRRILDFMDPYFSVSYNDETDLRGRYASEAEAIRHASALRPGVGFQVVHIGTVSGAARATTYSGVGSTTSPAHKFGDRKSVV